MTEINHPPINPEYQAEPTFEEAFAGKMATLLTAYKYDATVIDRGYKVTYPSTDRIDVMKDGQTIDGAFRIRMIQSLVTSLAIAPSEVKSGGKVTLDERTNNFTVIALEYGQLTNEVDVADDEDFTWQPYVISVADSATGATDILDGATGQVLSGGDLFEANHRLDFFARQISSIAYELTVKGDADELSIVTVALPVGENRRIDTMFKDFDHVNMADKLYEFHDCYTGCPVHVHPEPVQN